jgi:hypothetical protein
MNNMINDYLRCCDACGKPMSEGYVLGEQYACSDKCALTLYDGDKARMNEDLSHAEEADADFYFTNWPSIRFDDDAASPEMYNVIMGDFEFPEDDNIVIIHKVNRVFSELTDLECQNIINMIGDRPNYLTDMNGKRDQFDVVFLNETLMQRVNIKCHECKLNFRMINKQERQKYHL